MAKVKIDCTDNASECRPCGVKVLVNGTEIPNIRDFKIDANAFPLPVVKLTIETEDLEVITKNFKFSQYSW